MVNIKEELEGLSLNGWAQIAQIVSGFATFLALLFAAYEYYIHKKNNQYEAYSKMNERYCNNSSIQKVLGTMVESYSKGEFSIDIFNQNCRNKNVSINDKEMFLRFFEELSYAIKERSIHEERACYYFGYYAVVAYLMGKNFVSDLENGGVWSEFEEFAANMNDIAGYKGYYHLEKKGNKIVDSLNSKI